MNVFLTGATGVIGRRVVPLLVAAGHRVSAMVHAPEKAVALTRAGARPVKADLVLRSNPCAGRSPGMRP